jgi:hypothetical protein
MSLAAKTGIVRRLILRQFLFMYFFWGGGAQGPVCDDIANAQRSRPTMAQEFYRFH